MLMLGIKPGDYIVVGDDIVIQAVEFDNQVRVGIDAPKSVPILRGVVYEEQNPTPKCVKRASLRAARNPERRITHF